MRAIFKKEFLGYFRNMTGYIFLSFFIFVTGLFFSVINIFSGLLDYQYVLSNISMLFLIIIPLLTMNLFSQEKRNKTDQLLFTAPISISKITLGKYFASAGFDYKNNSGKIFCELKFTFRWFANHFYFPRDFIIFCGEY